MTAIQRIRLCSVFLLLMLAPSEGTLGSMGFMSLKRIPGGFNAVIEEPVVTTKVLTGTATKRNKALPPPSTTPSLRSITVKAESQPSIIFRNEPNQLFQGIVVATNALGFLLSLLLSKTTSPARHYHVDLLGTGAIALGALPALLEALKNPPSAAVVLKAATSNAERIQHTSAAVVAWSTTLASFLLLRVVESGGDSRLDVIMRNPTYCAGFWAFSALWGIICGLPYSVGLTSSSPGKKVFTKTGMGMFWTGLSIEVLADYQKWAFKRSNKSGTDFCNVGLWGLSQHPNWFGNLLLWTGILVTNIPALVEKPKKKGLWNRIWGWRRVVLAAVGPWFLWRLFYQQATGAMLGGALEATRKKYGYGRNRAYTDYINNTPLIIPKHFHVNAVSIKS